MRHFIFLILVVLHFGNMLAQTDLLQKKISFHAQGSTLEEVLQLLTRQTGVQFVYSPDIIDVQKKIYLRADNYTLKKVLNHLFEPVGIRFSVVEGQIILSPEPAKKKITISGTIKDASSGEYLVYSAVSLPAYSILTSSNLYGYYSLKAPQGFLCLNVSYVGYKPFILKFEVWTDTIINIELLPDTTAMHEIVVTDFSWQQNLHSIYTGLNRMSMQTFKEIPQILGESDVLKGLQALPGVQAAQEGSNSLYIRGGNPDQNLYVLDGVSMYNINHLFGYFSIFNADAIQNTMLYKSGFPAKYGGRLSSIVEMKLKEGNTNRYQARVSIGTLASSVAVEGPVGNNASFFLSGRRTYFDLLLKPALYYVNLKSDDSVKTKMDANFYDVVAKVNVKINQRHHLYFSSYLGGDLFGSKDFSDYYLQSSILKWGNSTMALRWNIQCSNKLFVNNTLTFSQFNFDINSAANGLDTLQRNINASSQFSSGISDYSFRSDWEYYYSDKHTLQFGAGTAQHQFNGGKVFQRQEISNNLQYNELNNIVPNSFESHIYAEDLWKIVPKITIQSGVHAGFFSHSNYFNYSLQPRLGLHYRFHKKWAAKASYSRMAQFLHQATTGTPGTFSFDIWVPLGKNLKPQICDQIAVGTVFIPNQSWEFGIEMYYKKFENLVQRKLFIDEYSSVLDWGQNWTVANGQAKGIESFIHKKAGKLKGWLSYTLSLSERDFNGVLGRVSAPLENSHVHLFNCNLKWQINQKISLSALWTFGSGALVTFPKQKYPAAMPGLPHLYYTEGYNNYKLSPYHRLDIGVSFFKKKKWYDRTWNIGVYNTYNQQNPNFIEIRNNKFIKYSYFSLVPSISYIMFFNRK